MFDSALVRPWVGSTQSSKSASFCKSIKTKKTACFWYLLCFNDVMNCKKGYLGTLLLGNGPPASFWPSILDCLITSPQKSNIL